MNISTEIVAILISLIAIFLTILAGFGGVATFLWNQFSKVHSVLSEIKLEYVQKQECLERRQNCSCVKSLDDITKELKDLKKTIGDHESNSEAHRKSKN